MSNTKHSSQAIDNQSFSETHGVAGVIPIGYDGNADPKAGMKVEISKLTAKKITEDGDNTYVATAPIGTLEATAGWQVKKIAVSGGTTTITWADGNANFDNIATDLTSLTYS